MPTRLRKQKVVKPRAKQAPRLRTPKPVRGATISAPRTPKQGPRMGLGQAQPARRQTGLGDAKALTGSKPKGPQVLGTEVEPGFTPTITPNMPPPESLSTAEKRNTAWNTWNLKSSDLRHQLYLAALAYGDPDLIKQYGDVVPTPTGALQTVAREEEQAKKQTGLDRNAANTFFSGMHLEDRRRLGDEAGFKRKAALDNWEKAKQELTVALQEAEEIRQELLSEADREDIEAFEATEPEPKEDAAAGGGAAGKAGGGKGKGKGKTKPKIGLSGNRPVSRRGPNISNNRPARPYPNVKTNRPAPKPKRKR